MLSGVASNMVAFVGVLFVREKSESMEIDQQPASQRPRNELENLSDQNSHEQAMADLRISESNVGDTVTHTATTWDDAT